MVRMLSTGAGMRIAAGLELALDAASLLFLPILTIAPLGIAALASTAGACALGLVFARGWAALLPLRVPASLLGMLLVWGALSAIWSIHPLRSLEIAARVGGLVIAGFALIGAVPVIAHPRRLLLCALLGLGLAIVLVITELSTNGLIYSRFFNRGFLPWRLDRASVAFAILLLPALATLIYTRATRIGVPLAAAMIGVVYILAATIAKFILPVATAAAALIFLWRRIAWLAAALSVVLVLTAPLSFPQLAALPGMIERADAVKMSAGHRLAIWSFVGQRIAERPFLGWGLDASRAIPGGKETFRQGQTWLPLHPHNGALQVWLELGAPGAALFALIPGLLWLALGRAAYPRLFEAAAGGSLVAAMIAALGTFDLWHEWWVGSLWLMLFLVRVMGSVCRDAAIVRTSS